jgi:hypothetical protein
MFKNSSSSCFPLVHKTAGLYQSVAEGHQFALADAGDCGNQQSDIYTRFESEFVVKAKWDAVKNLPLPVKG